MLCLSLSQRENKQLRDTILRLEQENDNLAQELVASKVTLRTEMDRVSLLMCYIVTCVHMTFFPV